MSDRRLPEDVDNVAQFLVSRGYPDDENSMVVLTDARDGPYWPSGANILAAMDWLVSEPDCCCFLHYSGADAIPCVYGFTEIPNLTPCIEQDTVVR